MVKTYNLAKEEKDTYEIKDTCEKECFSGEDVLEHWNTRAKRKGVQAVMSARHSLKENTLATKKLQEDILKFLDGYISKKNIFELGFGIGRMTSKLAKNAENVVGCDISPIMFEKAKRNLKGIKNIELHLGKITDFDFKRKSFDLVFESIVLLHILNKNELKKTIDKMKSFSDKIFLCEHTYEGPDFPISKYSILRKVEEYEKLLKPYKLTCKKTHLCAGDNFTLMLFEKK